MTDNRPLANTTKRVAFLLLFTIALPIYSFSQATITTGFDNPIIGEPLNGDTDGTGFLSAWSGSEQYLISEGSLNYQDLIVSGNKVSTNVAQGLDQIKRAFDPIGEDGTTQYISFLIRPQGTLGAGNFNGYFGLDLRGSGQASFFGKPGGGNLVQYSIEQVGGAFQVSAPDMSVINETAFIVIKIEFKAGNDDISMFVNPNPNSPEPTASAVNSMLDLGRLSSVNLNSSGEYSIDEIRFADSFNAVTPTTAKLIPTIGQWGLMILVMIISCLALGRILSTKRPFIEA